MKSCAIGPAIRFSILLSFALTLSAAHAQVGTTTDQQAQPWDAGTRPPNWQAPSTLTVNNDCDRPHRFFITVQNAPFLDLKGVTRVEVDGKKSKTLEAKFHTDGMTDGDYTGLVTILCLDCREVPPCVQDRKTVAPHVKVVTPATNPSTPATPEEKPPTPAAPDCEDCNELARQIGDAFDAYKLARYRYEQAEQALEAARQRMVHYCENVDDWEEAIWLKHMSPMGLGPSLEELAKLKEAQEKCNQTVESYYEILQASYQAAEDSNQAYAALHALLAEYEKCQLKCPLKLDVWEPPPSTPTNPPSNPPNEEKPKTSATTTEGGGPTGNTGGGTTPGGGNPQVGSKPPCPQTAEDCERLRLIWVQKVAEAKALQANADRAKAYADQLQQQADVAAKAAAKAAASVPTVNEGTGSMSSGGVTLTSHDLQLANAASQQAWADYKAGNITAERLEDIWGKSGDAADVAKLRDAENAAIAAAKKKADEAAQAAAAAKAAADSAKQIADAAQQTATQAATDAENARLAYEACLRCITAEQKETGAGSPGGENAGGGENGGGKKGGGETENGGGNGGSGGTLKTNGNPTGTQEKEGCPPFPEDCDALKAKWEELQKQAGVAQALADRAQEQQAANDQEAAWLEAQAGKTDAEAYRLTWQAHQYEQLAARWAADEQAAIQSRNTHPVGSKDYNDWDKLAQSDALEAQNAAKDAANLEAQEGQYDAQAAKLRAQATELRGLASAAQDKADAAQKAADLAWLAWQACEERKRQYDEECKDKGGSGGGGGGGGAGTTLSMATPAPEQPPPLHVPTNEEEQPCQYSPVDGYFEPTQGVWQDDPFFADKPGKELVRTGDVSYRAELPMIAGRDTVLYGVEHYTKGSGQVDVKDRENIALTYKTNCTNTVPARFKFTVTGAGQAPIVFYGNGYVYARIEGPPGPETTERTVKERTYLGIPKETTFKLANPGPYTITAELVKFDDTPTGISMTLGGEVVRTHGPVVNFVPVALRDDVDTSALIKAAGVLAEETQKYVPDFYPLKPGDLPTKTLDPLDFTYIEIPNKWFLGSRQETLMAWMEDSLTAGTFLNGAGRVMVVLDDKDFHALVEPDVAGLTMNRKLHFPDEGVVLNWKLALIPETSPLRVVAHELIHTLPDGWSSAGMLAECGIDYHGELAHLANGIRLVGGGEPMRKEKDGSRMVMGAAVLDSPEEALNNPMSPDTSPKISVRNASTGAMEERYLAEVWITQCSYWHLSKILVKTPDPTVILVRGFIGERDGKAQGEFHSFYNLMGEADAQGGTGAWSVILRDRAEKALGTYPFTPHWDDAAGMIHRKLVAFDFRVPSLAGAEQADLIGPEGLLDSVKFSARAPEIRIQSPAQDSQVAAGASKVRVNWTATGEPGTKLLYTVLYSPGDDRSYGEQSFEQSGNSFVVRLAPGVKTHYVKVIVTDGTRSAESVVKFSTP